MLLEMKDIMKNFTGTRAVDGVDFDCRSGEIHCLVGENGAGKSTLMKILAGVYKPDKGVIRIAGKECSLKNNADARFHGVGVVYQELSLLPDCTVAENISLGAWPRKRGGIDWEALRERASRVLSRVSLKIDPEELIRGLPMAVRQMVEIGKVLAQEPELIIFDEPTASLSKEESTVLFEIIRRLKAEGKGIIYISHRLEEVFALADRVTIMKDGKKVATDGIAAFTEDRLVSSMVGRELKEVFPPKRRISSRKEVFSFSVTYGEEQDPISLSLEEGEVLGIGGLQGQGQIRLLQSVFGLEPVRRLDMFIHGKKCIVKDQIGAVRAGIALVPENRGEQGVFPGASVHENLAASTLDKRQRWGLIRRREEKSDVDRMIGELAVKISSRKQRANSLSGGNMQKLVIGKWLIADPRVVILLEPTKGVDVGTKQQIYRIIRALAEKKVAVILYTSDMMELIGVSDRVLVMNHNAFTAELTGGEITEEAIMKGAVATKNLKGKEV